MLTPEGVLTIPASTPGFLIVEFITQNLKEAGRRLSDRVSLVQVMRMFLFSQNIFALKTNHLYLYLLVALLLA